MKDNQEVIPKNNLCLEKLFSPPSSFTDIINDKVKNRDPYLEVMI